MSGAFRANAPWPSGPPRPASRACCRTRPAFPATRRTGPGIATTGTHPSHPAQVIPLRPARNSHPRQRGALPSPSPPPAEPLACARNGSRPPVPTRSPASLHLCRAFLPGLPTWGMHPARGRSTDPCRSGHLAAPCIVPFLHGMPRKPAPDACGTPFLLPPARTGPRDRQGPGAGGPCRTDQPDSMALTNDEERGVFSRWAGARVRRGARAGIFFSRYVDRWFSIVSPYRTISSSGAFASGSALPSVTREVRARVIALPVWLFIRMIWRKKVMPGAMTTGLPV